MLWRIVDINRIRKNIARAREIAGGVYLVVKADAYGCGIGIAPLVDSLTDGYAVANAVEGAELRRLGITKEILILGYSSADSVIAAEYGLTPCIGSQEQASGLKTERAHIVIDTGMNRYGVKSEAELLKLIESMKSVRISGLFTHLYHNSEENVMRQCGRFDELAALFGESAPSEIVKHVSASGGLDIVRGRYDFVRLGIGAYKDANFFLSCVTAVKRLLPGECLGYDGAFVADKATTVAVVSGGYADGIPRAFSGGKVWINGDFRRVIGNICMDVFFADVSGADVKTGDKAIITDNDLLQLSDFSRDCRRTEYETLTAVKGRVKRVYFDY